MENTENQMLPREKAMEFGLASLQDRELLALVIKSGCAGFDVFELSQAIIDKADGFNNLLSLNLEELVEIKGIKKAKGLEIMAILEIAKRLSRVDMVKADTILNPEEIVRWLRFNIGYSTTERFLVVFVNGRGKIIRSEVLFTGSRSASLVSCDEVLRKALLYKASAIVIAHNHPNGLSEPSGADIEVTNRLKEACKPFDVRLLDHLIVSANDYYSFKRAGLL